LWQNRKKPGIKKEVTDIKKTIALLTDFGLDDNFVGVMKGVILNINPNVNLVDISHSIKPHDIFEAAFLLKGTFKYFSKGTIFLVVIDPGVGTERKPIIVRTKSYFFIGPDNGVLSLAAEEDGIKHVIEIKNKRYFLKPVSTTFHGRDIFAPAAAHISKGKTPTSLGKLQGNMKRLNIPETLLDKNTLKGRIIHIDRFGNLITNIKRDLFTQFSRNRKFKIRIRNKSINRISQSYQAVKPGYPLAIFGSLDYLEISVNRKSAKDYFSAKKGTGIDVISKR